MTAHYYYSLNALKLLSSYYSSTTMIVVTRYCSNEDEDEDEDSSSKFIFERWTSSVLEPKGEKWVKG